MLPIINDDRGTLQRRELELLSQTFSPGSVIARTISVTTGNLIAMTAACSICLGCRNTCHVVLDALFMSSRIPACVSVPNNCPCSKLTVSLGLGRCLSIILSCRRTIFIVQRAADFAFAKGAARRRAPVSRDGQMREWPLRKRESLR